MHRHCGIVLCALLSTVTPVVAGVTNATSGGPVSPTLQAAVNAAQNGDRLLVSTGRYAGNTIITNRSLTIEGGYYGGFQYRLDNRAATLFDGGGVAPVMFVDRGISVTLDNLTLYKGGIFAFWGSGVFVGDNCTVTARTCDIRESVAWYGGGVCAWSNATIVLIDTEVQQNTAINVGGGVYGFLDSDIVLQGDETVCRNNAAPWAGGVAVNHGTFLMQQQARIADNVAAVRAGGLLLENGSSGVIKDTLTEIGPIAFGNAVTNGDGGGVYLIDSSLMLSGANCRVNAGIASRHGGGVYMSNSHLRVIDRASVGGVNFPSGWNRAEGDGGGVYMLDSVLLVSNEAAVFAGEAKGSGGGVYAERSVVTFRRGAALGPPLGNAATSGGGLLAHLCTCRFDEATIAGNRVWLQGGGVYLYETNACHMTDSVLAHNTAWSGGALFITSPQLTCRFEAVRIVSNTAAVDSGGMFCIGAGVLQLVDGCELRGNVCSGWFGAARIDTSADAELRDVEIVENQSRSAAGGIGGLSGRMTLQDVAVIGNHTAGEGGGLYVGRNCRITARGNLELHGNRAACGGAAYVATSGVLAVWGRDVRPRVTANEASGSGGGFYLAGSNALVELVNVDVGLPGQGNRSLYVHSSVISMTMPVWASDTVGAPHHIGGGGVALLDAATLRAHNCRFIDNTSSNHGGGVLVADGGAVDIDGDPLAAPPSHLPHSQMLHNRVELIGSGGAVFASGARHLRIRNSLLGRNGAVYNGGGVYILRSPYELVNVVMADNSDGTHVSAFTSALNTQAWVRHCTIANNSGVGVLSGLDNALALTNVIVWGHSPSNLWFDSGTQYVHCCTIQGGWPGSDNINADPVFVMPALLDYRLGAGTPCTAGCPAGVGIDCIGFARPLDGTYEMGAYEYAPSNVVAVWPTEIDFGPVHLGDTATALLNVESLAEIATEWAVHDTWTPFWSDPTTGTLPAHGYQPVELQFMPLDLGPTSRVVYLLSTGGGQDVLLRGEGVPEPALVCAALLYSGLGIAILNIARRR